MAVERDAESTAGSDRESALVSVRHLQLRELGARDVAAARRTVGTARVTTAAAGPPVGRVVSGRPRPHGLSPTAARPLALLAAAVPVLRSGPSYISTVGLHA